MADDKNNKTKRANAYHKTTGYAAQRKYHATNNPEKEREWRKTSRERRKGKYHKAEIRIPIEYKPVIDEILASTGLSMNALCLGALEEKYGITLHKPIDNNEE